MTEYKLTVLLSQNRSYVVTVQEKQHGLWTTIGNFRIRNQKLWIMNKHETWIMLTDQTNADTFWEISLEKIERFYKITLDALNDVTDSDFTKTSENSGPNFLIYVNEY